MQAKDLPDAAILSVLRADRWTPGWTVAEHFPAVPYKVVLAKLRQLHKRGLVHGCPCGCRGDWHLPCAGRFGNY